MSSDDGDIVALRVSEARTFTMPAEPGTVVLMLKGGDDRAHYIFEIEAFARFAKQLAADAALLSGNVEGAKN